MSSALLLLLKIKTVLFKCLCRYTLYIQAVKRDLISPVCYWGFYPAYSSSKASKCSEQWLSKNQTRRQNCHIRYQKSSEKVAEYCCPGYTGNGTCPSPELETERKTRKVSFFFLSSFFIYKICHSVLFIYINLQM